MKKNSPILLTGLVLLLINSATVAQTVLQSADNFVVFSSTGAVHNTGNSHLTGNVGAINGAVSVGINIDGTMHVDDGAATTAAADLLAAYNYLSTLTPNFLPASPILGNSTTLPAGVYRINVAAGFINGDLTLDAQGDPNARFIFQIMGTLNTSANSRVMLINGALACNVFWITEGAVDIGANTIMKGNVIADNAAILVGADVNLEGRALSTTGAISFTGLTANMPLGCLVPVLTGPAQPVLGSVICYSLFSSNGNVTNSGVDPTTVSGDIGTNLGVTAGYLPSNVNGTIHLVPDASTGTAKDDLLNLDNNYFSTLTPDIQLLYPAAFGNGLVLTPHTYYLNGATSLLGTVTLNAQNNPDAVFVIKIDGPFSTTASARVLLINGAQAKNVFWKVSGAATISTLSEFKGTLVSNAAVVFAAGALLEGRALTTNGALTTNSLTATLTAGCATLPVSWLYFKAKTNHSNVVLEWATSNEVNNNFFTIERSEDGVKFDILTTVNATTKPTGENKYSFTTNQPSNLNYYRLSQTDLNGEKDYFRVISVKMDLNSGFKVVQFVDETNIAVYITGVKTSVATMELLNMNGQKLSTQKIDLTAENNTFNIAKPTQKGVYLLYIESEGKKLYAGKVII